MAQRRQEPAERRPARFGVYLDEETHASLRKAAIDERTSATELVERLIKTYLKRKGLLAKD